MNNEAKVRRSTKSVVRTRDGEGNELLGYRGGTKDATNGKGKRGQKRKSIELEADKPEPDPLPQVACAVEKVIPVRGICGQKRKRAALEPDEPEPKPQAARIIEAPEP